MRLEILAARTGAAAPDPATIAAIVAALDTSSADVVDEASPKHAGSPWRAAGRSVEAFDAYDTARRERGLRRGSIR